MDGDRTSDASSPEMRKRAVRHGSDHQSERGLRRAPGEATETTRLISQELPNWNSLCAQPRRSRVPRIGSGCVLADERTCLGRRSACLRSQLPGPRCGKRQRDAEGGRAAPRRRSDFARASASALRIVAAEKRVTGDEDEHFPPNGRQGPVSFTSDSTGPIELYGGRAALSRKLI